MSYFQSNQSPIKPSAVNTNINNGSSFWFDPTSTPNTKINNSHGDVNVQDNYTCSRPLIIEQPPLQGVVELDNFFDKSSFVTSKSPTTRSSNKRQMSDADQVIELVTGVMSQNNTDLGNYRSDLQTNNRQFPGPAGILPRLHVGLESDPRLANIMRLHKGSDLKIFTSANEQPNYIHKSPSGILQDEDNDG